MSKIRVKSDPFSLQTVLPEKTKIKTKGPILNISLQICESDFKSGNTVCMCTAAFYREIRTEIKIDESS